MVLSMEQIKVLSASTHVGHQHGAFGEFIEWLLDLTPLNETVKSLFNHIIVDSVNVFALLLVVMVAIFFLSTYIDMGKLNKKLGSLKSIWGFMLAIAIGVLSPFCSCSTIPVLMGFLSVGVPVPVALCYLTASSMLNISALVSLYATSGTNFTLLYIGSALLVIILSSIVLSFAKLDNTVSDFHSHHHQEHKKQQTLKQRITSALLCTANVVKRSYLFILLGVILSAAIMTYFSVDTLSVMVKDNSVISTLLVGLVGIPLHSDIFSISSIITLLRQLSTGIALTFTLATMAISLPAIVILTRAIKAKTVFYYCGIIVVLTLLVSYIIGVFAV